jgi:hypothetical protein
MPSDRTLFQKIRSMERTGGTPGAAGPSGPSGPTGPEGPSGTGAAVIQGSAQPSPSQGNDGDCYLKMGPNNTVLNAYTKVSGEWV